MITNYLSTRILALDPATSSGYSFFKIEEDTAILVEYGDWNIIGTDGGQQCISMKNTVLALLVRTQPHHVVIEDFFFRSAKANGSVMNCALRAATWMACSETGVVYTMVSPLKWKLFITGTCKATKSDKRRFGTNAEKRRVVDALWSKYGIQFSNYSLSYKTRKPISMRYDIPDAVAIGIHYILQELNIRNIQSSITTNQSAKHDSLY